MCILKSLHSTFSTHQNVLFVVHFDQWVNAYLHMSLHGWKQYKTLKNCKKIIFQLCSREAGWHLNAGYSFEKKFLVFLHKPYMILSYTQWKRYFFDNFHCFGPCKCMRKQALAGQNTQQLLNIQVVHRKKGLYLWVFQFNQNSHLKCFAVFLHPILVTLIWNVLYKGFLYRGLSAR